MLNPVSSECVKLLEHLTAECIYISLLKAPAYQCDVSFPGCSLWSCLPPYQCVSSQLCVPVVLILLYIMVLCVCVCPTALPPSILLSPPPRLHSGAHLHLQSDLSARSPSSCTDPHWFSGCLSLSGIIHKQTVCTQFANTYPSAGYV